MTRFVHERRFVIPLSGSWASVLAQPRPRLATSTWTDHYLVMVAIELCVSGVPVKDEPVPCFGPPFSQLR